MSFFPLKCSVSSVGREECEEFVEGMVRDVNYRSCQAYDGKLICM